jgi:hypothetical protein
VAEIVLSSGDVALVDEADYAYIARWKWKRHPQGYAARTGYRERRFVTILMHREIAQPPVCLEVDHINWDKLDNRRANLRCVTHSENEFNRPAQRNNTTSGVVGVCFDRSRRKWKASVGKRSLGRFNTFGAAVAARRAVVPVCAEAIGGAILSALAGREAKP